MRAVQLIEVGKPLEDVEVPFPEIEPTDILIRVAAAGICHSDAHYRAGISEIDSLPLTLGHEIAGRVEKVGSNVTHLSAGDRVCVHYLIHCGSCEFCLRGLEQFCRSGEMIGKHRDGGYAEFIKVPSANAFPLPDEIALSIAEMSTWLKSILQNWRQRPAWGLSQSTPDPQIRSSKSKRQPLEEESMSHWN